MKQTCYSFLISLLNKKDYSTKTLIQKAQIKSYEQQDIDDAIALLLAQNYLNDQRYATNLIEYYSKTKGKNFIYQKLTQKLIPKEIINELIDQEIEPDYNQVLTTLKSKLRIQSIQELDYKNYQKAYRILVSRGFLNPQEIINKLKNIN
jgi:regulatory protein